MLNEKQYRYFQGRTVHIFWLMLNVDKKEKVRRRVYKKLSHDLVLESERQSGFNEYEYKFIKLDRRISNFKIYHKEKRTKIMKRSYKKCLKLLKSVKKMCQQ